MDEQSPQTITVKLIDNGKKPDDFLNGDMILPLPADTPFGNLQLKFMKIINRVDEANRQILDSNLSWHFLRRNGPFMHTAHHARHVYANEYIVYMMRRIADELIAMIGYLDQARKTGQFPHELEDDSLASAFVEARLRNSFTFLVPYLDVLRVLNEISNAYKHSFINSDINMLGAEEACVHALALKRNKLSASPQFYNVALAMLVDQYNAFYQACIMWLREYCNVGGSGAQKA